MKLRAVMVVATLIFANSLRAQDLDLNSISDAEFRSKVDPLAKLLTVAVGGFFSGDVTYLPTGGFRISVNGGMNIPSGDLAVGPMKDVDQFSIPMFYAALGVDKRVELSGKFAAANIGNRSVIITGYGIRYKMSENINADRSLSFGIMVNALRGPEDFRIFDMTIQFEYLRSWKNRSIKASIGGDFSEMRLDVKADNRLLIDKNENIERTLFWIGFGAVQNFGNNAFGFLQIQQGESQKLNIGFGVRL